jgi:hypothetical protein
MGMKGPYGVHPSVAPARAILENLRPKTGRSLQQWSRLVESEGPAETRERRAWLKEFHKLGGTAAWMIVDALEGRGAEKVDPAAYLAVANRYVEKMYGGTKSALRPVHDALVKMALTLGRDVRICPCQTIVPLYRNHVFAQIKPATRTRLDFGLALKNAPRKPPWKFLETGGLEKGDRITHRIPVETVSKIDEQLKEWLTIAYDLDA